MSNPPSKGLYDDSPALTTVFDGGRPTVRHLRKSKLVVVSGADQGREIEVGKASLTGGRSAVNDLVLSDKAISGSHFELVAGDDGYRLRDLDSTNGTFIGDLRIAEVWLRPGQQFSIGNTTLRFSYTQDVVEIPLSKSDAFQSVLGSAVAMREIFATLEKVAPSDLTVLVTGETGTGKEMIARGVHEASPRRARPLVVLDCGAIPKDLIESTLFGHEKGSFTGAVAQHQGCFEQAQGGTIFLDEIGELDVNLQPKLLRVLENREIKRVGGDRVIKVDVRVVAATNRDLREMVTAGLFREDLYFRLSVVHVEMPPLRNRREDVPALAQRFLDEVAARRNLPMALSTDALAALRAHRWPGNVRELKNVVERAASLSEGPLVERTDLMFNRDGGPSEQAALKLSTELAGSYAPGLAFKEAKQQVVDAFEQLYLRQLLDQHEGNITRSANDAGLTRYHLRELLKRHGLTGGRE